MMIGYYLLAKDIPKNTWLRWSMVVLWDAGGVAFGIWIFFVRRISTKTYDLTAVIGGIGFVLMLIVLTVYNRNWRRIWLKGIVRKKH